MGLRQKLNPQAIRILVILEGRETLPNGFHCPIEWGYADGHTKRITDIARFLFPKGQKIISDWCDCGRHTARVLKRKIVPLEENLSKPASPDTPQQERKPVSNTVTVKTVIIGDCCWHRMKFGYCEHEKITLNKLF